MTLEELVQHLVDEDYKKNFQVLMNDCHYYFPQVPDYFSELHLNFYVSGLQFESLPGSYYLPCSEGIYNVYTDQKGENRILMRTNGS